ENGWEPPKTWDETMALCEKAKAKDKYLFVWGKEASLYWSWLALDMAVKDAGLDVWRNIANLKEDAWSHPSVIASFEAIEDSVKQGCWIPGGEGTHYTLAQTKWSLDQQALMYSSGSWIAQEMKEVTADDFQMTAWPYPTLRSESAIPFGSVQVDPGGQYVVPAEGANTAGAMEILRAWLSKDAAAKWAETTESPSVVKDSVPADGFGSTALLSTVQVMDQAGENQHAFFLSYMDFTDLGDVLVNVFNQFLGGQISSAEALSQLQDAHDEVREDDSLIKRVWE
ncbi:MAG: extracellular solute-binding protein, partial [Bifidobacteriaceae bacterium]|nr:extracellular solute-binding protein [Bifidobacteriaceae bacterium]